MFWKSVVKASKSGVPEISVEDLKASLDKKQDFILLDVREQGEYDTARIPGSKLIPMNQVPDRVKELDPAKPVVVHCHHGGRSARVAGFLLKNGFKDVVNLEGGIDAWSERIDPSVPRY